MEFTGERVVLDYSAISEELLGRAAASGTSEEGLQAAMPYLIANHLARYYFAAGLLAGCDGPLTVLDAACGSGYGSYILASHETTAPRSVIGVDLDREAIAYANAHFVRPGLEFRQTDCRALPWAEPMFDLIASFETLEHLDRNDGARFVERLAILLRPHGLLVMSTPMPPGPNPTPSNPFHRHEYGSAEFEALLASHFAHHCFFEQAFMTNSVISPRVSPEAHSAPSSPRDHLDDLLPVTPAPVFFAPAPDVVLRGTRFHIAVCSHSPLPSEINPLIFSVRAIHAVWQP